MHWSLAAAMALSSPVVELELPSTLPEHARASLQAAADSGMDDVDPARRRTVRASVSATRRGYGFEIVATHPGMEDAQRSAGCDPCGITEASQLLREEIALAAAASASRALLTVHTQPVGAAIVVDDEPMRSPAEVLPGRHRVVVVAPGHVSASQSIELDAGERREILIALDPAPRPDPRRWTWAAAATGALSVGLLAGGTTLWAVHGRPSAGSCREQGRDPNGRCARMYATRTPGIVLTSVAIAGVAAAIALGVRAAREKRANRRGVATDWAFERRRAR